MLKQNIRRPVSLLVAIFLFVAVGAVSAQVKQGKSRPLKTAYLMKGVMKPHCESLKKSLSESTIAAEGWEAVTLDAALLNEASFVLMDDGRCPDGVWAEAASKKLRQGSADVLKAAEAKDAPAAKAAFASLTKACGSCHDAHKPKK